MEPRHPKVWWKYSAGTVIIWKLFWLTNKNPCDSYKYIFIFESRVFEQSFLNSLILYQFCTKEVGTLTVFGCLSLINPVFLPFNFSVLCLALVSIEKVHQTLKGVFVRISKHLEVCQKYFRYYTLYFQLPWCLKMRSYEWFVESLCKTQCNSCISFLGLMCELLWSDPQPQVWLFFFSSSWAKRYHVVNFSFHCYTW